MQEKRRKEKWKVPLPFEDRLFLDRVRTRSLVRKLGVSFDLLPTEQLAVVETSQQLHAKRTYGHRGRSGGVRRGSPPAAGAPPSGPASPTWSPPPGQGSSSFQPASTNGAIGAGGTPNGAFGASGTPPSKIQTPPSYMMAQGRGYF